MKQFLIVVLFLSAFQINAQNKVKYSEVAQDLLQNIMAKKSYEKQVNLLAESTLEDLVSELDTDTKKLAFWLNIYNSFIQISLTENPKEYEDRGAFFKKERVKIAGETLSFDDIESCVGMLLRCDLLVCFPLRARLCVHVLVFCLVLSLEPVVVVCCSLVPSILSPHNCLFLLSAFTGNVV